MKEDRQHFRFGVAVDVEVEMPDGEIRILKTQNLSEGGIFLVVDNVMIPAIGTELYVKVNQTTLGDGEEPPRIKVTVSHSTELGMGLRFMEDSQ